MHSRTSPIRFRSWRAASLALVFSCLAIPSAQEQAEGIGPTLVKDPAVRAALDHVRANEAHLIEEQVRLCEIPAPPFKEQKRGAAYARIFQELGLQNVRTDKVGNVLGERPGLAAKPHLVFTAHLDTVFPEETNVKVTREGTVLRGPWHRRRLPGPGGAARRCPGPEPREGDDPWAHHVRRDGRRGGTGRPSRRQAPLHRRAQG